MAINRFTKVPHLMDEQNDEGLLSDLDLKFYRKFRKKYGRYEQIYLRQKTIAEDLGMSLRTVSSAISNLKKHGWIVTEEQENYANLKYWFCDEPFVRAEKDY